MTKQKVDDLEEGDVLIYERERYVVSGVDWDSHGDVRVYVCGGPNDCVDWVLPLTSGDTVAVIDLPAERSWREDFHSDEAVGPVDYEEGE
jgi:hypothetical protein